MPARAGRSQVAPDHSSEARRRLFPSGRTAKAFRQPLGNQALQRLLGSGAIRAKLTVSQPGDPYEQEADRVAEQVLRQPGRAAPVALHSGAPDLLPKCEECASGEGLCPECAEEEETVQRKEAAGGASGFSPSLATRVTGFRQGGQPLPGSVRDFFEPRFDRDFGNVRIHTDARAGATARELNARAYTIGQSVVFAPGQFAPGREEGRRLIAHELAHTVQAARGGAAARSGLVHRHADTPCPRVGFRSVSARDRAVSLSANQVIERAYVEAHRGHVILTGSEFEAGGAAGSAREVRLPRGTPGRRAANAFLSRFRGLSRQLAPDIVDFTDHVFYEIKTLGRAGEGVAQLQSYYRLADAIQREIGGRHWNQDLAAWYPPHILPLLGLQTRAARRGPAARRSMRLVCTEATNHSLPGASGLLLYEVLEREQEDDDDERRRQAAQIAVQQGDLTVTWVHPQIRELEPRFQEMIRRTIGAVPVGSRYLIIAPPVFYRRFIEEPQLERTLEPLRIRSMDPRRNPVMGFRSLGWTVIGIGTALMAVAFWAPLLIEAAPALGAAAAPVAESTVAGTTAGAATVPPALGAAAVPVGEAAAGATGGGATILPFIRSAGGAAATVAQSEAARELARAAGVLIVLGIGSAARAEGDFHLERAEAVRAVPDSAVRVSDARRREVSYQGQRYFVIGLARASGPEGGSGEATETVDSR